MPKTARRARKPGEFRHLDLVVATASFAGRPTPPAPLNGSIDSTPWPDIPEGTLGLYHGSADGAHDVEFDVDGAYHRVEVDSSAVLALAD